MKKLSILAIALLVAGSAFASGRLTMEANATNPAAGAATGVAGVLAGPATTNNDDSCDIGVAPAATLLLPYFNVDLGTAGTGRTTVFSITNTSRYSQIAHVTIWTDWSAPVLDFNLFLTGYDVVPVNLYDIIARGLIPVTSTSSPNARTSSGTNTNTNSGTQPQAVTTANNWGNPNFANTVGANCASGRLPGQLPPNVVSAIRAQLTTGTSSDPQAVCSGVQVGSNHGANTAVGYVTIDVNADCNTSLPNTPGYFSSFILYDNVLIGDYYDVNQSTATGNYAGGNPMVHIRAVPEGGGAGSLPGTFLPFTFYNRYTPAANRQADRRQPLPSAFAARWISGSTAAFDTQYKFWREGYTGAGAGCDEYVVNDTINVSEIVRFDERENAGVVGSGIIFSPFQPGGATTREADLLGVSTSTIFPTLATTDAGGWMYMNLSNGGNTQATALTLISPLVNGTPYSAARAGFGPGGAAGRDTSQNWVIISMFAEGRYGVDYDAAWLGNGCSPYLAGSGTAPIGPSGGALINTLSNNYNSAPNTASTNVTP